MAFTAEELIQLCGRYDIDSSMELDLAEFAELLHDLICADQIDPTNAERRRSELGF